MAQFKINLLTPQMTQNQNNGVYFLETPISEFYNQIDEFNNQQINKQKNTYCYTFNEKFSVHANGQKEFSFSMLRNIWLDDEFTTNPFIAKISVGTQLLLIDKYDNEYFFTIKDIKYSLQNSNIIYQYSCQDSFTYQHIRQNSGYSIANNIESADFIGAKTIDWWANKIQQDCYISYNYIPLSEGLYIDYMGNLHIYNSASSLTNVKKIIKHPYPNTELFSDYYEPFIFTTDGGNASSSLISLGEEVGLVLNYIEHNIKKSSGQDRVSRTNQFNRYFWYEPQKNEYPSNIRYSPKINIQSFDFAHSGSSLTTILNVDSVTKNDELISILPNIPPFFSNLFASMDWKTSYYEDGYFQSVCQNKIYYCENEQPGTNKLRASLIFNNTPTEKESWVDVENGYVYIKLSEESERSKIQIPSYYNKVALADKDNITSVWVNNDYYSSKIANIEFGVYNFQSKIFTPYNDSFNLIPNSLLGTELTNCYLRLKCSLLKDKVNEIKNLYLVLKFYRETTSEELEFATMADKCPWLENKLIDFSYFLNQGIISTNEYKKIIDKLTNDLRIINGQLIYYSAGYYNAIRQKTKDMADLLSTLDSLGAAFNSDIVNSYKTKGSIDDVTYFNKAYTTFLVKYNSDTTATQLLDYNELLTDYLNKCFQAQQRFLKNIYYFKQYFNQKVDWGKEVKLSKKTLFFEPIPDLDPNQPLVKRYLSFTKQPVFNWIDKDFTSYNNNYEPTTKIFLSDKVTEAEIVNKINYTNYWIPSVSIGAMIPCNNVGYSSHTTYFRRLYKVSSAAAKNLKSPITIFNSKGQEYTLYQHSRDEDTIWYGFALPDYMITDLNTEVIAQTVKFQLDYKRVTSKELINDYLYQLLQNDYERKIYWYDDNLLCPVASGEHKWLNDEEIEEQLKIIKPSAFYNLATGQDYINNWYTNLMTAIFNNHDWDDNSKKEAVHFYKAHFPITSVYYSGQNYKKSLYAIQDQTLSYQPANKSGATLTQYIEYLKNKEIYHKEETRKVASPFAKSAKVTYTIPIVNINNEQDFFRRVPSTFTTSNNLNGLSFNHLLAGIKLIKSADENSLTEEATASALNAYYALFDSNEWKTSGLNVADFENKSIDAEKHTGYYDSSSIIYTPTATSYSEYASLQKYRIGKKEITDVKISSKLESDGSEWEKLEEVLHENKNYYVYCKFKTLDNNNDKHYFNYYSKIGLTYSSAISEGSNLQYYNSYLRPVKLDEILDANSQYKVCLGSNLNIDFQTETTGIDGYYQNGRLSRIRYYFIDSLCGPISSITDSKNKTLRDLLDGVDVKQWEPSGLINATYCDFNFSFIVFKEENFTVNNLNNSSKYEIDSISQQRVLKADYRYCLYNGSPLYDADHTVLDFLADPKVTNGFYTLAKENADHHLASTTDTIIWEGDNKTKFFKKNDEEFVRVYTIPQIKESEEFLYITGDELTIDSLSNVHKFENIKVFCHQESYDIAGYNEENQPIYKINTDRDKTFITEAFHTFDFSESNKNIIQNQGVSVLNIEVLDEAGNKFTRKCQYTEEIGEAVTNISNGEFWFKYHDRTDCPLLFEQAAVIESELSLYWSQAYSASLGCEYFLPEFWQPRVEGGNNYFSNNIIITNNNLVYLSNRYLPDVQIYSHNGVSYLPKYNLEYLPSLQDEHSQTTNSKTITPNNKTTVKTTLSNDHPIKLILQELQQPEDDIVLEHYNISNAFGKTTYYYNSNRNSGMKWSNFVAQHSKEPFIYENFTGNYIMVYKILKNRFENRVLTQYEDCKNRQQRLWKELYSNYPGILLEDSYANEDVSSSFELYNAATLAFKDKQKPERSYNISLIDAYNTVQIKTQEESDRWSNNKTSWTDYRGQELKIGDGILVDVEEYYDTPDNIYQDLSQYLFITDISYDLRKDSDINITVNTIKYQDKLIKRLAKLIK